MDSLKKWWKSMKKTVRLSLRYDWEGKHWVEISREKGSQYDFHGYENNIWPKKIITYWNSRDGRVKKVAELVFSREYLFLSGGYVCRRYSPPRDNEIMVVRAMGRAETEKEARLLARKIRDTDVFYASYSK